MSGKKGQKSAHAVEIPTRYTADFLRGMDRRCKAARDHRDFFAALVNECGGEEGLGLLDLEALKRFAHLCRRLGKHEETELGGGRIDAAALNDATRSWLGLLRQVEAIKGRRQGGGDLARAIQHQLEREGAL